MNCLEIFQLRMIFRRAVGANHANSVSLIVFGLAIFSCIFSAWCYFTDADYVNACASIADHLEDAMSKTSKPGHVIQIASRINKPKSIYYNTS